jgi:hypothetical protein
VSNLVIQFGDVPAVEKAESERRREERYHFEEQPVVVFLAKPSFRPRQGALRNVTNGGIALITSQRYPPGTRIVVRMPTTNPLLPDFRLAEVRHFSAVPNGGWLLGCRFLQILTADEMLAWLQKLPMQR